MATRRLSSDGDGAPDLVGQWRAHQELVQSFARVLAANARHMPDLTDDAVTQAGYSHWLGWWRDGHALLVEPDMVREYCI